VPDLSRQETATFGGKEGKDRADPFFTPWHFEKKKKRNAYAAPLCQRVWGRKRGKRRSISSFILQSPPARKEKKKGETPLLQYTETWVTEKRGERKIATVSFLPDGLVPTNAEGKKKKDRTGCRRLFLQHHRPESRNFPPTDRADGQRKKGGVRH